MNADITYRGFTLTHNAKTGMWTGKRGSWTIIHAFSSQLHRDIDQLLGPEVRDCCTGEGGC